MPRITLVTGCFNGESFLNEALDSVFKQTFDDFEILVIDDASTDKSPEILSLWKSKDKRLRILQNPQNIGLANTLNRAIESSDSEYIARFDVDDIMYPERLKTQINYLEKHPVDMIGSAVTTIGHGLSKLIKYPTSDERIRLQLLFQSPFAHPSVIFKRSTLGELRYNAEIPHAEDYALWVQMAKTNRMSNITKPLLYYRRHANQISSTKISQQNKDAGTVRLMAIDNLIGLDATEDEKQTHSKLRYSKHYATPKDLIAAETWLIRLTMYFKTPMANEHIQHEWYLCCIRASHFGIWTWKYYNNSQLVKPNSINNKKLLSLYLLCRSKITYKSKTYSVLESII